MRLPRFWSFFVNNPKVLRIVLKERPDDFPKSEIINATLASLLGTGVFVSNGALWKHQRRIIDPAFAGGKLRHNFQSMLDAGNDAVTRLKARKDIVKIEEEASQIAADIIFRTLLHLHCHGRCTYWHLIPKLKTAPVQKQIRPQQVVPYHSKISFASNSPAIFTVKDCASIHLSR